MRVGPTCFIPAQFVGFQLYPQLQSTMAPPHSAALVAALLVLTGVVSHVAAAEDIKIQSIDRKVGGDSKLCWSELGCSHRALAVLHM
jgi:hypothetical protein